MIHLSQTFLIQSKSHKISLLLLVATLCTLLLSAVFNYSTAQAADVRNFRPGNIIGNEVFRNNGSMTASQIQSFLDQKNSVCLKSYRAPSLIDANRNGQVEDWTSAERYGGPNGNQTMTAAQLIKAASDIYQINPQVLLATLQKEQGLITRSDCPDWRYRTAFGYGCPDTAACDSAAFGFTTQIDNAAYHFKGYYQNSLTYVPFTKGTYSIGFNPDSRCGSTKVSIENEATASLYSYTPYQPNNYAKNSGGDDKYPNCGAFGNLNFWKFFTDWFGSTHYTITGAIRTYYDQIGGFQLLGNPIENEVQLSSSSWYQCFQKGCIIGKSGAGFWESRGDIRKHWAKLGYQTGRLGYPTGPEKYDIKSGNWLQEYEHGTIIGKAGVYADITGGIRSRWVALNSQHGTLGTPKSSAYITASKNTAWQEFTNGFIIWSTSTGAWESKGEIRKHWAKLGYQTGSLGFPTGPERYDSNSKSWSQEYEKGIILGNGSTGFWDVTGDIRQRWNALGAQNTLGLPKGAPYISASKNTAWQEFTKGFIIWSTSTGAWESKGEIRKHWAKLGYQTGSLGFPTGPESYNSSTKSWSQEYEHGVIYHSAAKGSWNT